MNKYINILISDRNPNVRKLLCREVTALGYRALQATNGIELIEVLDNEKIDLIILDPEVSFLYETSVLKKMQNKTSSLPVIIHSFQSSDIRVDKIIEKTVFIEKGSSSIETIKQEIRNILNNKNQ